MNYVQIWSVYYILHILYDRLYKFSSKYSTLKHSKTARSLPVTLTVRRCSNTQWNTICYYSARDEWFYIWRAASTALKLQLKETIPKQKCMSLTKCIYNCKQSCLKRKVLFEAI